MHDGSNHVILGGNADIILNFPQRMHRSCFKVVRLFDIDFSIISLYCIIIAIFSVIRYFSS